MSGVTGQDVVVSLKEEFVEGGCSVDTTLPEMPWCEGTTSQNDTILCNDGTISTDWYCASGRAQCPPNKPTMCANDCAAAVATAGGQHCCTDSWQRPGAATMQVVPDPVLL